MKCPACSSPLSERTTGALTVDICEGGCGGIYLDRFELNNVDEAAEAEGQALLEWAGQEPQKTPDREQRYRCPKCEMIMMRGLFKPQIPITIDTCPQCAGVWLDHGELAAIRQAPGSDHDRRRSAQAFVWQAFADLKSDKR